MSHDDNARRKSYLQLEHAAPRPRFEAGCDDALESTIFGVDDLPSRLYTTGRAGNQAHPEAGKWRPAQSNQIECPRAYGCIDAQ